jgi:hypothetical protein
MVTDAKKLSIFKKKDCVTSKKFVTLNLTKKMSKKRSRTQFSVRNLDEVEECSVNEMMASAQPMDLAFHPVSGLLGVATIEGTVELYFLVNVNG